MCLCSGVYKYNCEVLFEYCCFSVATIPDCTVDKRLAAASENVTYTCSVTSVCGRINVLLTIENDDNTVAADRNTVTWTTQVGSIANARITCRSVIACQYVDVFGEFIDLYFKSTV